MAENVDNPILTLPNGKIQGIRKEGVYGANFYSFEGIPYGKPPIGKLRFKAPQPAESWNGVRDCTKVGNRPVQRNYVTGEILGDEDCLYLNVYTKTLKSKKRLPVMVWIYGGGYINGGAVPELYSPDYFMHEDIILVEFNYRLCGLGFLSLWDPTLQVPGNAALKDQVLALKWIKQHIEVFNGDSNNITIFGESAGGASAHYMIATEQTRGLFNKAIVQSASILNQWANTPQEEMGFRLAKYHGYTGENDDKEVLKYLQGIEANKLVDHALLTPEENRNGWLYDFGPTVEPYITESCVIPKSPKEMLKTAWGNNIPIMVGGTSFEGLFMNLRLVYFPHYMKMLAEQPEFLIPLEIKDKCNSTDKTEFTNCLIKAHFHNKPLSAATKFQYMDYYSFRIFWHGIHRAILGRLATGTTAPTYYYRFDFDSPTYNHYRKKFCMDEDVRGVAHADELPYLFNSEVSWKLEPNSAEFKIIKRMIAIWTSFAKYSNPNCDEIKPIVWHPLHSTDPYKILNISDKVQFMELPEKVKLDIWDSVYKNQDLY